METVKTELMPELVQDALPKMNTRSRNNSLICFDEFFTGTNEYIYRDTMFTVLRTIKLVCPEAWILVVTHDSMLKQCLSCVLELKSKCGWEKSKR